MNLTKGQKIEKLFTKEQRRHIDVAIPQIYWEDHNPAIHIMYYEGNSIFGTLVNLEKYAKEKGIEI